jgi:hypothetical protein
MLINPLTTTYLKTRLLVITPVTVEKLASEKSTEIRTRQEALQTIFFNHLDIFYPTSLTTFSKKGVFQQPRLFSTAIGLQWIGKALSPELGPPVIRRTLLVSAKPDCIRHHCSALRHIKTVGTLITWFPVGCGRIQIVVLSRVVAAAHVVTEEATPYRTGIPVIGRIKNCSGSRFSWARIIGTLW